MNKIFDVIVIGQGIVGLSLCLELIKKGISRVAIVSPKINNNIHSRLQTTTTSSCHYLIERSFEAFTRIFHAHGKKNARDLLRFNKNAYMELLTYLREDSLPFQVGNLYRLGSGNAEEKEIAKLIHIFKEEKISFAENIHAITKKPLIKESEVSFVDPQTLFKSLCSKVYDLEKSKKVIFFDGIVEEIVETKKSFLSVKAGAHEISAEFVVLANHLGARRLFPWLNNILIPVCEQWQSWELKKEVLAPEFLQKNLLVWNYSNEWAFCDRKGKRFYAGGGRFLRKLAGIGQEVADYEEKIASFLKQDILKTFGIELGNTLEKKWGLECVPCDEMPLIGPLPGSERILLAAGFMGQGLTSGFYSGKVLSEMIVEGRSQNLPPILLPTRLRTLS